MILSVSRRTDIPNYYAEWFFNRIKAGYVCIRNPMNPHQISRITLSPDVVDCIVFWTKNPANMLDRLELLEDYRYYFQFTLTPYGKEIERNIPDKKDVIIPTFKTLSKIIGADKVIWRYDPIFFSDKYTPEYHLHAFSQIAEELRGYTDKCVISFVDTYRRNKKRLEQTNASVADDHYLLEFSSHLKRITDACNMKIATCSEKIDLSAVGIEHNSCIDKGLIEKIIGCKLKAKKDSTQRQECGCIESIDIGAYNTCMNLCSYCYANFSPESVLNNQFQHDPSSPLICGQIGETDVVHDRKTDSFRIGFEQLNLWDV